MKIGKTFESKESSGIKFWYTLTVTEVERFQITNRI